MSDRIKPQILASAGMGITAAGIFIMTFIHEDFSIGLIIAALAIIGIGFAFFSSPNTNAIMSSVDRKDFSVASSILATGRTMGQSVSMGLVTVIVSVVVGNVTLKAAPPEDIILAIRVIFMVMAALCAIGIWFSSHRN